MRVIGRVLAAGLCAAAVVAGTPTAAGADPSPETDYRTLAAVGSEITQFLMDGVANVAPDAAGLASWDADSYCGSQQTTGTL